MNCANLLENLGYTCAPRQNGAFRLWSPFTFDDGEHLGLFLEPSDNGQWRVTDHADTLMHASALGAKLTQTKLNKIRAQFTDVKISEGGALIAVTGQDNLARTITDVLNVAIAISHAEEGWKPKTREQKFIATVGQELEAVAGKKKLLRNVAVCGVSGHQMVFPFAIDDASAGRQFIQPVAYGDEPIDWANVYKTSGKMFDLKSAGADDGQRFVIVEDNQDDEELGEAVTLLSHNANVLLFSHRDLWLPRTAFS